MQNRSQIKAVVFDWDGVIVDSMPMIVRGIRDTAKSYGVHVSVDDVLATYVQPRHVFYENLGIKIENMEELKARHATNISKHFSEPKLFDDVLPVLAQLKADEIKFGIASGAEKQRIRDEMGTFGLQTFVASENILGGNTSKSEKLIHLIAQFGVAPAELLFVGDLPSDIQAAKKAGVKSAGISRDEAGRARLKAENPDYLLNSLSDLLKIIESNK